MTRYFQLIILFLGILNLHYCYGDISRKTILMNAVLDSNNYDARVRPNDGADPIKVKINCYIASFSSISESDMEYTLDMYLRQTWIDPRLKHNYTKPLVVPPKGVDKIWYPDLFVSNEKRGELHEITQPNRYIRIAGDGEVLLSQRFTMTLACPMKLNKFPFDTQLCGFSMESYGYSTEDVVFKWVDEDPIQISEDTELPKYDVQDTKTGDCTKVYSTGSFTCIEMKMTLGRELGYFIFNSYIPTFIVTALPWLGFWLLPSPSVTRVALTSICLLCNIGIMEISKKDTPKVSYVVAMDVWMVMSLVFTVLAMVETVFVSWMYQKGEQSEAAEEKLDPGVRRKRSCCNWKGCAIKVDILSRMLIPALYFAWAGFYWFVYSKFDL